MARRVLVVMLLAGVLGGSMTIATPAAHAASGIGAYEARGFSVKFGDTTCWIGTVRGRASLPPGNPSFGTGFVCSDPILFLRDRASRIAPRMGSYGFFFSDGTFAAGLAPIVVVLANRWVFPGVTPAENAYSPGVLVGTLVFRGHRGSGTLAFAGLGD